MPNNYTFQILDPNDLVSAAIEASITIDAQYVIGLVSRYIDWKGTIDFVVEIRPGSELTWSDADGLLPSIVQTAWTGSAWTNQTLTEALTGVDPNPSRPNAGLTIYLADDGTIKNYGAPVWFDPNPGFEINPAVPAGSHDFVSILIHEIFHSLGFIHFTQEWAARIVSAGDVSHFTGPQSGFLYGGAIPFRTGSDHYGYAQDPSIPIKSGLMYEFGNYQHNRWEIGRIDLAMLADLGYTIKTYDGLPLFEMLDSATNLTGTEAGEMLHGDYHSNILSGLGGNDRMEAGSGNDQLSGGDGNDLLRGGAGVDSFDGGGNLTTDDPITIYGDRISFAEPAATQGAVADLRTGIISNDGFGNSETMTGIESLGGGTAFADTFNGNDDRNALLGSRADILNGHGGDDVIRVTAAPAAANGGAGTDLLELSSNGGFLLPDGNGDGLAETAGPMPGSWLVDLESGLISDGYGNVGTVAGFENISGSAATDTLGGDENANILKGNGGIDYLFGAGGGDRLEGGDGNDELDGGEGSDLIRGDAGDDRLYVDGLGMDQAQGGAGTDMLIVDYGDSAMAVTMGVPGADPDGGHSGSIGDASRAVSYSSIENFNITTGSGNDVVRGGSGDNYVYLGAGDDHYVVAGNFNSVDGGEGIDGVTADFGSRTAAIFWNLFAGTHNFAGNYLNLEYFVELTTGSGQDNIGTANVNRADQVTLGAGNDTVALWNGMDTVNGGVAGAGGTDSGLDTLILNYAQATNGVHNIGALTSNAAGYSGGFSDDSTRLAIFQAIDRFLIATGSGNDNITTGDGNDQVRTGGGNDILSTGGGDDLLVGGSGDDSYDGGAGIDTADFSVETGPVAVNLHATQSMNVNSAHPLATRALAPGEALDGAGNYESLAGIENLVMTGGNDFVQGSDEANRIDARAGNDRVAAMGGDDVVLAGAGNDIVFSGGGNDTVEGGDGDDWLDGDDGNDVLRGDAGNDVLHGGAGVDSFQGGSEDLSNLLDPWGDRVTFYEVRATQGVVADLRTGAVSNDGFGNAETMTGIESFEGDTAFADTFHGNDLRNLILAGRGDTVHAHGGDDRVEIDLAIALADGGAGTDTLKLRSDGGFLLPDSNGDGAAEVSGPVAGGWTVNLGGNSVRDPLGNVGSIANFENVEGGDGNDSITGNAGANILSGGGGDDVLTGGGGADRTQGGLGNDIHNVGDAGDVAVEGVNEGADTVATSVSYTLGANIENLQAANIGGADPLSLTGNGLANFIWGTQGNNVLNGAGGADFMIGYAGNDFYFVDNAGDIAYELDGGGADTVVASIGYALAANVENLQALNIAGSDPLSLTGNAMNNYIWATQGNNILNGGGGADFMIGYAGDDIYHVDHRADVAYELEGGGTDTVVTTFSYTLAANVENLQALNIAGSDPLSLTGNALRNFIWGTQGDNVIDGAGGADLMIGYGGNDVYFVDNIGDVTYEEAGGGADTVVASSDYALGANIENLQAAAIGGSAALSLTGNDLGNYIWGTQGDNVIAGRGGNDVLFGFGGADRFLFDTAPGGAGYDSLGDFQAGTDKIVLDNSVFTALADGALPSSAFVTGTAAADADDRIIFDSTNGYVFYDADGNGAGEALLIAVIPSGQALTAADIVVI